MHALEFKYFQTKTVYQSKISSSLKKKIYPLSLTKNNRETLQKNTHSKFPLSNSAVPFAINPPKKKKKKKDYIEHRILIKKKKTKKALSNTISLLQSKKKKKKTIKKMALMKQRELGR